MAAAWFANTGAQNDCPPRPLPNNPWHPKRPKGHALLHGIFAVRCPEVRKRWFGGPGKRQHAKHTGQSAFQRSMGFGAAKTHGTLEGGNPPPTDFFFGGRQALEGHLGPTGVHKRKACKARTPGGHKPQGHTPRTHGATVASQGCTLRAEEKHTATCFQAQEPPGRSAEKPKQWERLRPHKGP